MAAHADAGEAEARSSAGRDLARVRWAPETVLRRAVETVVERHADLDAAQLAAIEAAITGEPSRDSD